MDSPLTDRGRMESELLGQSLNQWLEPPQVWMVSPQGRARESSRLVRAGLMRTSGLPAEEIVESVHEIRCGEYEGCIIAELDPVTLQKLRTDPAFPYPGGESIVDVMTRGKALIERILERARSGANGSETFRAVVVSHGNFIRAFAALASGLGPTFAMRSFLSNTGLSRLLSSNGGESFKILTWNDISHAHGLEAQFTNLGTG